MVTDNSKVELPTVQGCPRASRDRRVWRIGAIIQGFGFASLYLLLKKTTQNNLTLNKQIQQASYGPDCPSVTPRKNLEVIILKVGKLRSTELAGLALLAGPGISIPHTHAIIFHSRKRGAIIARVSDFR